MHCRSLHFVSFLLAAAGLWVINAAPASAQIDALAALNQAEAEAPETPEEANAGGAAERPISDDWLEAGDSEDEPGSRVRSCSILLDDQGMLNGKIFRMEEKDKQRTPVRQIRLYLVQEGKIVTEGTTNPDDGTFQLGPVKPGIYSLIGQGEDGMVAFSLNAETPWEAVKEDEPQGADDPQQPAEPADDMEQPERVRLKVIETCALNPADMPMALQLVQAFLGVGSGGQPAEEPELEAPEDAPVEDEAEMPAAPKAAPSRSGNFRGPDDPNAVASTSLSWLSVQLRQDGTFIGRVRMLEPNQDEAGTLKSRPPVDMRVFVLQTGKVVAQAACSPKGYFVIEDLKPGLYSFLSVGRDAFSAITVDLLPAPKKPADDDAAQGGNGIRSASFRHVSFLNLAEGDPPTFLVDGVPSGDAGAVQFSPITTPTTQQATPDLGPLVVGNGTEGNDGGTKGSSNSSFPNIGTGGGGGSAPNGGGGGGFPGGGSSGGGGNVPEIDPASAGVGLSVLIGLLLLLVNLFRPR